MTHMVVNEKSFYKTIAVVKNIKNTDPMMGYIFIPMDMVDLKEKTWSQRVSFLN